MISYTLFALVPAEKFIVNEIWFVSSVISRPSTRIVLPTPE
jgi:hypothetical protein